MTLSVRLLEARQPDPNKRHVIEAFDGGAFLPGPYISPSALETAKSCEARWGWAKLEGIREPESPAQALGTSVHAELEAWLLHATPVRSPILLPALQYFPRPMAPGMTAEKPFAIKITRTNDDGTRESVIFVGLKDCEQYDVVFDLKTTSDLAWMKSPEVLEKDIQATVYALVNMQTTGHSRATCRWVYAQTKGNPKSDISETQISMSAAIQTMREFFPLALRMKNAVLEKKKALDMQQNVASCGLYNKACFYTKNCAITPGQKFYALNKQERMREGLEPAHVVGPVMVSKLSNESNESNESNKKGASMGLKEKLAADLAKKTGGAEALAAAKEVSVIGGNIGGSGVATVDNASMNKGLGVAAAGISKFKALSEKLNGTSVPKMGTEQPNVGRAINPPDATPDPRLKKAEPVAEHIIPPTVEVVAAAPTEEKRKPGRPVGSTKKDVSTSSVETKKIVENVVATYVSSEAASRETNREMEMRFEIVMKYLERCSTSESAEDVAEFARKVVEGIR